MPLFKIKYIILAVFFFAGTVLAETNELNKAIDSLIQKKLPSAFVGIVIKNSENKIFYKRNSNKHFIPASNTKLFTCTAAMLDLGKDFKYTTSFMLYKSLLRDRVLDGNLYIKFTGDPTYTSKDLYNNLMQLKKIGVHTIRGNLVIDDTGFAGSYYAPGISFDDLGNSYAAPVSSLILDNNLLKFEVKGGKRAGDSVDIISNKQTRFFKFDNDVETVGANVYGKNYADISVDIDRYNKIKLTGTISENFKKEEIVAIQNPFKYASAVVKVLLRKSNIRFDRKIFSGKTPQNTDPVIVNASKPLPVLIKHSLKESDNLYADAFLKTMGIQKNGVGTYVEGLNVMVDMLRQITDIRFRNLKLYDGAGLSRYNLVTPEQIAELLTGIYGDESLNEYIINSLPVSGVDGTLKDRMNSNKVKGYIKAKTGSMGGVSALSGYIFIDRRSPIIFTVLINGIVNSAKPKIAKEFEDRLCEILVNHFETAIASSSK